MSSACINPVVYGYLNETYRKEFFDIGRSIKHGAVKTLSWIGLMKSEDKGGGSLAKRDEANQNLELNCVEDGKCQNNLESQMDSPNYPKASLKPEDNDEPLIIRRSSNTSFTMLTVTTTGGRVGDTTTKVTSVATSSPNGPLNCPAPAFKPIETIHEEVSHGYITSTDLHTDGSVKRDISLKRLKKALASERPRVYK